MRILTLIIKAALFLIKVTGEDAGRTILCTYISFEKAAIKTDCFTTVSVKIDSLEQVLKSIWKFYEAFYQYNEEKTINNL